MTLSMRCPLYRNKCTALILRKNIRGPLSTWRSTRPARTHQIVSHGQESERPVVRAPVQQVKTRVLSIDGGGVRGLIPALVLVRVENTLKELISQGFQDGLEVNGLETGQTDLKAEDFEVDLADYFTVFAGTSAGAILAAYFASKGRHAATILSEQGLAEQGLRAGSAQAAVQVFLCRAAEIFPQPQNILSALGFWANKFVRRKYSEAGVERVLKAILGSTSKLSTDVECSLIVPSFDLDGSRALSFYYESNLQTSGYAALDRQLSEREMDEVHDSGMASRVVDAAASAETGTYGIVSTGDAQDPLKSRATIKFVPDIVYVPDKDFYLWEVVRASTSAPTYFPVAKATEINTNKNFPLVDGGVVANNPCIQAIAFASVFHGANIKDMAVLSLGTGQTVGRMNPSTWGGYLPWIAGKDSPLLKMLTDSNTELLAAMLEFFLQRLGLPDGQYIRLQLVKSEFDGPYLASAEDIAALKQMDDPGQVNRLLTMGEKYVSDDKIKDIITLFLVNHVLALPAATVHRIHRDISSRC